MNEQTNDNNVATEPKKRTRKSKGEPPATIPYSAKAAELPRVLKMVPRTDAKKQSAEQRKLAGPYRIIHGSVQIALPREQWSKPDGSEDPNLPKQFTAIPGDEVWLNDYDAARMLDLKLIETLDARPSMVNKMFDPPRPPGSRTFQMNPSGSFG